MFKRRRVTKKTKNRILVKICQFFLLVTIILVIIFVFIFLIILPNFFSLSSNKTFLVISEKNNQIDKLTIIQMVPERKQTYVVEATSSARLISEIDIDRDNSLAELSWKVGTIVDENIVVDKSFNYETQQNLLAFFIDLLPEKHLFWTKRKEVIDLLSDYYFLRRSSFHYFKNDTDDLLVPPVQELLWPNCPVGIVNATSTAGLAGKISNLMEDSGFLVVNVGNFTASDLLIENLNQTAVYFDSENEQCRTALTRIKHLLPENTEIKSDSIYSKKRVKMLIIANMDWIELRDNF